MSHLFIALDNATAEEATEEVSRLDFRTALAEALVKHNVDVTPEEALENLATALEDMMRK